MNILKNKKCYIFDVDGTLTDPRQPVDKKFKDKFIKKNSKNVNFFKLKKRKIYFDLSKFIYEQLISFGILKIDVINKDTFDTKNNFFSARRSLKKNEPDYGRNISVIMIK